jgi:hypothetical protein
MTLFELYKAVNFRLAKDKQGNAFTPDNFNVALEAVNLDLYNTEFEKVMRPEQVTDDELFDFNWFRRTTGLKANALPIDYKHHISLTVNGKKARIVNPAELDTYKSSVMKPNPAANPVATFYIDYIEALPNGDMVLSYYRLPLTPYMDYVVNEYGEIFYMPVGSRLLSDGGNLVSATGAVLQTGVSHLTATAYPYTSATSELDWRDNFHSKFVNQLTEWGAMNLRDQMAEQISIQK